MPDGFMLPSPPAAARTSGRAEQEGPATSPPDGGLRRPPPGSAKPTGFKNVANWPPPVTLLPHRSPLWQPEPATSHCAEVPFSTTSAPGGSPRGITRGNNAARQAKSAETGGAAAQLSVGPKSAGAPIGRRRSDVDLLLEPAATSGASAPASPCPVAAGPPPSVARRQSDVGFASTSPRSARWATLKEQYEHAVHRRRPGRHWPDGNDPARDWRVDVAFMQGCLTHGQYEYGWDVFESVSPCLTARKAGDQELLRELPRTAVVLCLRAFSFCSPVQRWLWEARAWAVYNDVRKLTRKALDEARASAAELGEDRWKALLAHYERQGGRPLRDLSGGAPAESGEASLPRQRSATPPPAEIGEAPRPRQRSATPPPPPPEIGEAPRPRQRSATPPPPPPESGEAPRPRQRSATPPPPPPPETGQPLNPPALDKLTPILNQAALAMENQAFVIHKLFLMCTHADTPAAQGTGGGGGGQSVPSVDVLRAHLNELLSPEFNRACFAVGGRRCEKCKAEIQRFVDHVSSTGERASPPAQEQPGPQPFPPSLDALTPPPRASISSPSFRSPFLR